MTVQICFLPDDVKVLAQAGEALLDVADRAGIVIPTGCLMGSCHACEVEMDGEDVCGCITAIPADKTMVVIQLFNDPTW
jgi:ferredoxin